MSDSEFKKFKLVALKLTINPDVSLPLLSDHFLHKRNTLEVFSIATTKLVGEMWVHDVDLEPNEYVFRPVKKTVFSSAGLREISTILKGLNDKTIKFKLFEEVSR